jgi:hypothetical protein
MHELCELESSIASLVARDESYEWTKCRVKLSFRNFFEFGKQDQKLSKNMRSENSVSSDSCYLNYERLHLHFREKNSEDGLLVDS